MVALPAGHFTISSPSSEEGRTADEGPAHQVTFDKPSALGKYEITVAEWNACAAGADR